MDYNGIWILVAGGGGYHFGNTPASYCNNPSCTCINGTGGTTDGYVWLTNGHTLGMTSTTGLMGRCTFRSRRVLVPTMLESSPLETISTIVGSRSTRKKGAAPCAIDTSSAKVASSLAAKDVAKSTTADSTQ
ncbi:hypothetical protein BDW67DRAFT_188097 [Aspergillus spinulosporus]